MLGVVLRRWCERFGFGSAFGLVMAGMKCLSLSWLVYFVLSLSICRSVIGFT